MIKAYIIGWKTLFQTKKMWLGLYAIQFLVALFAIWPYAGYLGKTVGNSLDLSRSLGRFDYTFFSDFLIEYASGIKVLLNLSIGFILIYFLLSIFLTGGILTIIKNRKLTDSYAGFFLGAGRYFWRIFGLSFFFLFLQIILFAIFGFLFLKITNNMSPFELENELTIIHAAKALTPIYLLFAGILFMIHDLAKIILIHTNQTFSLPIKDGFRMAFQGFRKFFPLYLLNVIVLFALTVLYYFTKELFTPQFLWQVVIVFIFGQIYLLFRVGLKIVNLASMNEVYTVQGD